MTNEQLRIALTANAVTKQTRNHFGFSDPCGKTLEEYNKSAMLACQHDSGAENEHAGF